MASTAIIRGSPSPVKPEVVTLLRTAQGNLSPDSHTTALPLRRSEPFVFADEALENFEFWCSFPTFLEGKVYANPETDTVIATAFFAETLTPDKHIWHGQCYAPLGEYPNFY